MEKIVYKNETGIAVITPTANYQVKVVDQIIDAVIEPQRIVDGEIIPAKVITPYKEISHMENKSGLDLAMKDIPKGAEYKIVDESELPTDRIFRNAWNYDLKEDIPKSKEIWKEKLRRDRIPAFEQNDIFLRDSWIENNSVAIEAGVKIRDRLRDITNLVDSCKTISAIKKVSV